MSVNDCLPVVRRWRQAIEAAEPVSVPHGANHIVLVADIALHADGRGAQPFQFGEPPRGALVRRDQRDGCAGRATPRAMPSPIPCWPPYDDDAAERSITEQPPNGCWPGAAASPSQLTCVPETCVGLHHDARAAMSSGPASPARLASDVWRGDRPELWPVSCGKSAQWWSGDRSPRPGTCALSTPVRRLIGRTVAARRVGSVRQGSRAALQGADGWAGGWRDGRVDDKVRWSRSCVRDWPCAPVCSHEKGKSRSPTSVGGRPRSADEIKQRGGHAQYWQSTPPTNSHPARLRGGGGRVRT